MRALQPALTETIEGPKKRTKVRRKREGTEGEGKSPSFSFFFTSELARKNGVE